VAVVSGQWLVIGHRIGYRPLTINTLLQFRNIETVRSAHVNKLRCLELDISPKGIRPPAQGCCARLPWERRRASSATPTGLWPSLPGYAESADCL
jgi:hypothetical protein